MRRSGTELMRPEVLAHLQPTRLSFTRALVNRMDRERWVIRRTEWTMDAAGNGRAQYRVRAGDRVLSFVIASNQPRMQARSSRIIGGSWDLLGALIDGDTAPAEVARTWREIAKLYAGRSVPGTLVWCRANRSMRAFERVVGSLAAGRQPDLEPLTAFGYLMRNTGLDANGTFGTRSFLAYPPGHPLATPYFPQMLAAYLMREFSFDLADHLAACRSPSAARLDPLVKSYLGLGNGSGLGLVLWVHNHPRLLEAWLGMREDALERAYSMSAERFAGIRADLAARLDRAVGYFEQDRMVYEQFADSASVATDLRLARKHLDAVPEAADRPVEHLGIRLRAEVGVAALESVHALLIECLGDEADALLPSATADETLTSRPEQPLSELLELLEDEYGWALSVDLDAPGARAQVWYKSRDAEEPRRGPANEVPPGTVDLALALPAALQRATALLRQRTAQRPDETAGEFLAANPDLRWAIERAQALAGGSYHTPHANVHDDAFVPVHLIRLMNVAVYGIDKTRDYLGRNLRGVMFHGAPTREQLGTAGSDWFWPLLPDPVREVPA